MEYVYTAVTGDSKLLKGRISAASEQVAADALTKVGYRVVHLKPYVPFFPTFVKLLAPRIKTQELVLFSRQLAWLTESGIGIVQGIELLGQQTVNKGLRGVLVKLVSDVRTGMPVSTAMSKHPQVFSAFYSRMIAVGEQTGELAIVLRSLADYMEREATAKSKLRAALTYPIIVISLAIIVVTILVTVALPPLVKLFSSFKAELPLTTRLLLFTVGFTNQYFVFILLVLLVAVVAGLLYIRTTRGRYRWDKILLRLPVVGRLILLTELARACRSLSLLFRSGLPLPDVMAFTRRAAGNRVVVEALGKVERSMIRGEGLAKPMSKNRVFLPLMVAMTKVGEEVGNLDETLMTVAQNYDIEADDRMRTAISLMEPLVMIALGGLVAFIALSIFLPIYQILGSVGAK